MSHDVIRRLVDDAYRAQGSMSVGLPRVKVDASQLGVLLAAHDYYRNLVRDVERLCDRFIVEAEDEDDLPDSYREGMADAACHILQIIDLEEQDK